MPNMNGLPAKAPQSEQEWDFGYKHTLTHKHTLMPTNMNGLP